MQAKNTPFEVFLLKYRFLHGLKVWNGTTSKIWLKSGVMFLRLIIRPIQRSNYG